MSSETIDLVLEERLTTFIEALKVRQTPFLMKLEKEALEDNVPIIRPQTQALIQFLLAAKQPARILEVGAAVGYSSLFMREYAPASSSIVTIERDEARAAQARENYRRYIEDKRATVSANASEDADRNVTGDLHEDPGCENAADAWSIPELIEGDATDVLRELAEKNARDI